VTRSAKIPSALAACLVSAVSAQAQTPQGSTTIRGKADSVFTGLLASMKDQRCLVRGSDRSTSTITATCSGSEEELVFQVQQVGDSVLLSSRGTRGGFAALIVGLSVIQRFVNAPPPGEERRMAAGKEWPQDNGGRVGFLVFTSAGRRFAKAATSDTAWEVRPGELPPQLRQGWEDHINSVGFDARCARVFGGDKVFFVRWNQCSKPTPDLDRFAIYDANARWQGSAIGPSIASWISVMCPSVRSGSGAPGDPRCPPPWR
jgi:hypothetical protein